MNSEDVLREYQEKRIPYEKPIIRREYKMTFMFDALKSREKRVGRDYLCRQCSSCHGCR